MAHSFHLKFCRNEKFVQKLQDGGMEGKGYTDTAHVHTNKDNRILL